MTRPAVARPLPLSDGFRRIRDLAMYPQMIPGSQPMHVMKDDKEQANEAMAKPEVRGAVPAVSFGTVMVALQAGQAICVPT